MKLIARLFLTLPFVLKTFLYLRLKLSGNGYFGLIGLIHTIVIWIFLAFTIATSVLATLFKRPPKILKAEPYYLTITLVTLIALIGGGFWGDNLNGEIMDRGQKPKLQKTTISPGVDIKKKWDFHRVFARS